MDNYSVKLLSRALRDLDGIYAYIAKTLQEPETALRMVEELEAQIAVLRPDLRALILVYSDSETHSEEAARSLVALGYNHVYDFGAIEQWPYDTASGS